MLLEIKNLSVSFDGKKLLHDINLEVADRARHLLTGHNGSGKSTLTQTIAGNPDYAVDSGRIIFNGRDITNKNATARALLGIFLGAQHVPEIPGLTVMSFLKHSMTAHRHFQTGNDLPMGEFLANLETARSRLNIPREWLNRSINVGFSGGERKRLMLLRLLLTEPKLAILDEPDSGADASVQKMIADAISEMTGTAFLFVSHQEKFTQLANPTQTTVLSSGKIVVQ
ncbi:MAG: ATP-binding cassette domain-containing protein [Rickettsiales bacterium]|jgi:Fe-S cluster assembly ATP-binding protein|nr:ATP-binding cassette domain-containing protein [Rickettsiales bacterium]